MIRGLSSLNNNNAQSSCGDKIKAYWASIPLITKTIFSTTVILYLLSFMDIFAIIIGYLLNVPYETLYSFRIWTIATTMFVITNLLNVIFAMMSWMPRAIIAEKQVGSMKYLLTTMTFSMLIQVLFILLMIVLSEIFGKSFLYESSNGLWPLILCEITIHCNENPDAEITIFFLPCPITSKYYPWILVGFCTLLNNFIIKYDVICGLLFGYIYMYKLKDHLDFKLDFIIKCERSAIFRWMQGCTGYVPFDNNNSSSGFTVIAPSESNRHEVRL